MDHRVKPGDDDLGWLDGYGALNLRRADRYS